MAQASERKDDIAWLEASGLLHILRTLAMAVQPAKLAIALAGIVLTLALGTLLDAVGKAGGGVQEAAIARFIQARESGLPYTEQSGEFGVFAVWREHERQCVLGLLRCCLPGSTLAGGTPLSLYVDTQARPLRNLSGMAYGVWWLVRYHPVYFLFFASGALIIWSAAGGAICRIAAVHFARDEKPTIKEALQYAWGKLFSGFFLAPCIPLIFIAVTAVLLMVGGLFLRVPFLGDLIGGLVFGLAIFGGFVISVLLLGLIVGGSLFWPAVAVEGSDAFDAFSRGLSYPFSKPWKAILYGMMAAVYVSICWVFVHMFTFVMLRITRACVAFGTAPFGWLARGGTEEGKLSKLELLWPLPGPSALHAWPDWAALTWYEYISASLVAVYVLIVVGLMWSFLASFYFCGSTIIYYLLRRDVDGTDLEEIYVDEEQPEWAPPRSPIEPGKESAPQGPASVRSEQPLPDQGPPPADSSGS